MNELIKAWRTLLWGNVSYAGLNVKTYVEDVPEDQPQDGVTSPHYIWLHAESGADDSTKQSFVDLNVVMVDIVTYFVNNTDRAVCESIDASVRALLYSSPSTCNLSFAGAQFGQTIRDTYTYLLEEDGTSRWYRKISRYKTRVIHAI